VKYSASAGTYWMGCCRSLLRALVLCAATLPAVGNAASGDAPPSAPSSASPGLLARTFPLTGTYDWLSVSYYVTSQSFYDIDVQTLDIGRAWRLGSVLELQARLGAFHSNGERLDAPWLGNQDSTTSGVTFGGAARLYPFQTQHVRLFIDGAVEMLYTPGGNQFPAGGTGINAFLRAGGGLQFPITQRLALEAHYEYAHVSNGAGSVDQNPMWNGRGGGLTIRRSL
jgi:opacity protein-like surface antigen